MGPESKRAGLSQCILLSKVSNLRQTTSEATVAANTATDRFRRCHREYGHWLEQIEYASLIIDVVSMEGNAMLIAAAQQDYLPS